jgi:glycogen debranching enzyme
MRPLNRDTIPRPILEEDSGWVDLYWTAWELAWDHVIDNPDLPHTPYLDEAFQPDRIWIWDSCFMILFARYAPQVFPCAQTLDNLYALGLEGAEAPMRIHHPDNPPLPAWAERELYRITGDRERLRRVLVDEALLPRWFERFETFTPGERPAWAECEAALKREPMGYRWAGCPSGMDNTPRGDFDYDSIYWVDALAQQILAARCISELALEVGDERLSESFQAEAEKRARLLNGLYWDEADGCYYDIEVTPPHERVRLATPAGYWPLLAGAASPEQAARLTEAACDPLRFGGAVPFPAVSRDSRYFVPEGQYMQSAVWLPLVYMSIKALGEAGRQSVAHIHASRMLRHMERTFHEVEPHTIWECYAPDAPRPSTLKDNTGRCRPDFCGWSALGPIALLLENVLGIEKVDAAANEVHWRPLRTDRHGVEGLQVGTLTVDLLHEDNRLTVTASHPFTLVLHGVRIPMDKGSCTLPARS